MGGLNMPQIKSKMADGRYFKNIQNRNISKIVDQIQDDGRLLFWKWKNRYLPFKISWLYRIKCIVSLIGKTALHEYKKLHNVNSDGSKNAKIIKKWYYSASHWHLGIVMVVNIILLWFLLFLNSRCGGHKRRLWVWGTEVPERGPGAEPR